MQSPVLLLVFNRPEKTAAVMDRIRSARPPRLYIAADGPRSGRPGEAERCQQVRMLATAIDWPCEIKTLFRDQNLGCKLGVSSGIDWFFSHESEGIILEDDILPTRDFFAFSDALLECHRDDATVAMIGGTNLAAPHMQPGPASWHFTRYPQIWGWATWRRAWAHYDVGLGAWPAARPAFLKSFGRHRIAADLIADLIDRTAAGQIDTWDYQWMFACQYHGLVSIIPAVPLVENIGFDVEATHTRGDAPAAVRAARPSPLSFPLTAPDTKDTAIIDRLIEKHSLGLSLQGWTRLQVRRQPRLLASLKRLRGALSAHN